MPRQTATLAKSPATLAKSPATQAKSRFAGLGARARDPALARIG
jgi:hypothetical protein